MKFLCDHLWLNSLTFETASSALDIYRGEADLSRRVMIYLLAGLSFREFLLFTNGISFEAVNIDDINSNHQSLSRMITEGFRPLPAFRKYLEVGYLPIYQSKVACPQAALTYSPSSFVCLLYRSICPDTTSSHSWEGSFF